MSERFPGGVISATPVTPTPTSASGVWTLDQQEQAQKAGIWPYGGTINYIEDVFSTYLYTGNSTTGGTQTITNNIDISTNGGLVWIKGRSAASNHIFTDTTRGAGTGAANNNAIASNLTTAEDLGGSQYDYLSSFSTTGFVVTQGGTTTATRGTNYNAVTYASWTFRKQPKFFDIVTYTGNETSRTISHNLGSVPGCIIVKRLDNPSDWSVYHRSMGDSTSTDRYMYLNSTNAKAFLDNPWTTPVPTSTGFSVSASTVANTNGGSYVAYLFAHNAGGFGLTGTDNVISCGSYTGNGNATGPIVNLGYEPQWLMIKSTSTGSWQMFDNMRGFAINANSECLADTGGAETGTKYVSPLQNGFQPVSTNSDVNANGTVYIYVAIRRGPMKVPTDATKVFGLSARTGTGANATVTGGQVGDAVLIKNRGAGVADLMASRLTYTGYLTTSSTAIEAAAGTTILQANPWDVMDGVKVGTTSTTTNASSNTFINYLFRRAPKFFDVSCYTGTGGPTSVPHNLGVAPELMFVKLRTTTLSDWWVYSSGVGATGYLVLNTNAGLTTASSAWNNTAPTSTAFTVNNATAVNTTSYPYIAYLFATCPGVSKVGSYTGTGTTLQINCGFTSGARFVLIKRKDEATSGDWYVWDTARGIGSGNDPYFLLDSLNAEVTTTDYVNTYSSGFEITSSAPAAINANGGTFIFLAIA